MTTKRTTVVGVFRDAPMAELVIEALKDTGFTNDEILYSGVTAHGGDFFDMLARWSGAKEEVTEGDVVKKLTGAGLSEDEADYYAREYAAGHPIVAVKAPGREDSAKVVICSHANLNKEECADQSAGEPHAESGKG